MAIPATTMGGETTLVDGLAAARALRTADPNACAVLAEQEVVFRYKPKDKPGTFHRVSAAVLRLDPASGDLLQLRWSNKDRGILYGA
jgi:hypothetical protein